MILNELRTEKFRKLSSSSANSDTTEEIIDKRVKEISKHRAKIKELIEQSILEGAMYSSGNTFEGSIKSVNTLIKELMNQVVINTYTKIDYIKKHFKKEDEIQKLLRSNDIEQYSMSGEAENANALDEIIAFVKSQKDRDLRVTIKSIKDKFQAKPYGWQKMDIYGLVAELLLTKKIKLSLNQDELKVNESDTTRKICNDRNSESIVITIKENLSEIVISETKKHISDVFHQAISSNDQDELSEKLLELVQGKVLTYNKILFAYDQNTYPGKDLILRLKNAFEELASIKDFKGTD
ncbi:hypothetical protein H6762_03300 [Candidatus Nomurabacteria bacterium]|nr:hypothetical protein [Candidatus Nomurabacteria bacterium]